MNCPRCGHSVEIHNLVKCYHGWPVRLDCECTYSKAEALAAAQRAAAIEHLKSLGRIAKKDRPGGEYLMQAVVPILHAIAAYRAVGILKGRKP